MLILGIIFILIAIILIIIGLITAKVEEDYVFFATYTAISVIPFIIGIVPLCAGISVYKDCDFYSIKYKTQYSLINGCYIEYNNDIIKLSEFKTIINNKYNNPQNTINVNSNDNANKAIIINGK